MYTISIADAHNRLYSLLKQAQKSPITITRRGKSAGVLIVPAEYEELRRMRAYLRLPAVSREVKEWTIADEIYRAARQELEERP